MARKRGKRWNVLQVKKLQVFSDSLKGCEFIGCIFRKNFAVGI
jgi:hypothetical protein